MTVAEARPWYCENCLRHWADNCCDECGAFPLPLVKGLENERAQAQSLSGRGPALKEGV